MIRTILALVAIVLLVAGCGGNMSTSWSSGQYTELQGRLGYDMDGVQVGGVAKWDRISEIDNNDAEVDTYGAYILVDASFLGSISDEDPLAPPPVAWLDGAEIIPYGGFEIVDSDDDDKVSNMRTNYIAGLKYKLNDSAAVIVEYIYPEQRDTREDVYLGAAFKF